MWACPKCGRTFRNINQNHYCGKDPETIEEYIRGQPEEVQPILRQLQEAIHTAIPEAKEKISWSMVGSSRFMTYGSQPALRITHFRVLFLFLFLIFSCPHDIMWSLIMFID